jgi:hypothetical protein
MSSRDAKGVGLPVKAERVRYITFGAPWAGHLGFLDQGLGARRDEFGEPHLCRPFLDPFLAEAGGGPTFP